MKLNLDNDEIKRLYIEEKKLIKEIAEIMHCGKTTIQSRLKEMGVETTKNVLEEVQINYQITKNKLNNYIQKVKVLMKLEKFLVNLVKLFRTIFIKWEQKYVLLKK